MQEVRWQDRAYATIQETQNIPPITDRWSPCQPKPPAISQANMLVRYLSPFDAAADPTIEPTIEGGIIFEWTNGNRELNLSINPGGYVTVLQVEGNSLYSEGNLDLSEIGKLFEWLANG